MIMIKNLILTEIFQKELFQLFVWLLENYITSCMLRGSEGLTKNRFRWACLLGTILASVEVFNNLVLTLINKWCLISFFYSWYRIFSTLSHDKLLLNLFPVLALTERDKTPGWMGLPWSIFIDTFLCLLFWFKRFDIWVELWVWNESFKIWWRFSLMKEPIIGIYKWGRYFASLGLKKIKLLHVPCLIFRDRLKFFQTW